jgi:hypothetical protein
MTDEHQKLVGFWPEKYWHTTLPSPASKPWWEDLADRRIEQENRRKRQLEMGERRIERESRRHKKTGELKSEMCSECFSDLKNHSIRNRRKCTK